LNFSRSSNREHGWPHVLRCSLTSVTRDSPVESGIPARGAFSGSYSPPVFSPATLPWPFPSLRKP
jgi:hypothetical protein